MHYFAPRTSHDREGTTEPSPGRQDLARHRKKVAIPREGRFLEGVFYIPGDGGFTIMRDQEGLRYDCIRVKVGELLWSVFDGEVSHAISPILRGKVLTLAEPRDICSRSLYTGRIRVRSNYA